MASVVLLFLSVVGLCGGGSVRMGFFFFFVLAAIVLATVLLVGLFKLFSGR